MAGASIPAGVPVPPLCASISMLFADLPFLERFQEARRQGFEEVELWWPSARELGGMSHARLAAWIREVGLRVVLLNIDEGELEAGDAGIGADPARLERLRRSVAGAVAFAERLGCRKLNLLPGNRVESIPSDEQLTLYAQNLEWTADAAHAIGATVLVEQINHREFPGYLLPDTDAVISVVDRVNRPDVKIQFDIYHSAMAGEDVPAAILRSRGRIGHVQLADVPGRHEPGTADLDFGAIFKALADAGYTGPVGLEYRPTRVGPGAFDYLAALGWR